MRPELVALEDGQLRAAADIRERVAEILELTEEQKDEFIPSGQRRWVNRANWALSYLARAGALERPTRGRYRITQVGRDLLAQHPVVVTEKDLRQVPGYIPPQESMSGVGGDAQIGASQGGIESELSPTEQIEDGVARLHDTVAADLLSRLHSQDPAFFEQAVLDLIMAMGYDGAQGTATRTQLSNDGGIDGIVDQDALGLSRIYVQAN